MDEVLFSQPGLTNQPISHLDIEYFTDGNSFDQDCTCFLGIQTLNMPSLLFMSMEIYIKRGLINSGGKSIKYGQKILKLPKAEWAPKQVVVMHCAGHQKRETRTV
jgi:hypothetical protein